MLVVAAFANAAARTSDATLTVIVGLGGLPPEQIDLPLDQLCAAWDGAAGMALADRVQLGDTPFCRYYDRRRDSGMYLARSGRDIAVLITTSESNPYVQQFVGSLRFCQ